MVELKKRTVLLEESVDDNQAYNRRDTLFLSGGVPKVRADGDCNVMVWNLLLRMSGVTISEVDINVAHRISKCQINEERASNCVDVTSGARSLLLVKITSLINSS